MRIACLNIAELPLQLLLRRHPAWREHPVAVVDRDLAQGVVLWSNERARASRVLPGQRYAAALSLAPDLRAGEVPASEIEASVAELAAALRFYSPDVEPSAEEPGIFWLGASGLSLLYPSLTKWAELVRQEVERAGFSVAVVVGHSRFGSCALAKSSPSPRVDVIATEAEERERAGAVSLSRLGMDPDARDALSRLGITSLDAFIALPANGIRRRFGDKALTLHRLASGDLTLPLQPVLPREPVLSSVHLDDPEPNLDRLMMVVEREMNTLARRLDDRGEVLTAIAVQLEFDDGTTASERLQPASPTLDLPQLLELLRLRLSGALAARESARGVGGIRIEAEGAAAAHSQGDLFETRPARDLEAAARGMARVRAELGDDAVVNAVLRDAHLPEARFEWAPARGVRRAEPRAVRIAPLVRRIFSRPLLFSPARTRDANAEMIRHIDQGTVRETLGPYIVSGGWWAREVQREYYFVRTAEGRTLWMYFDRHRAGWFIHGEVE